MHAKEKINQGRGIWYVCWDGEGGGGEGEGACCSFKSRKVSRKVISEPNLEE